MNGPTAFILAGGRSTRMGSDKAGLEYGGVTLLERALAVAGDACHHVRICGSRERYGRYREVVEDIEPGRGPLSGIQAALHATQSELNLILSVDMPKMEAAFLRWLLAVAEAGEQWITVPESEGQLQPLCAVYRREVWEAADEAMAAGEYKVTGLFRRVATRVVTERELSEAGFNPDIFTNVNTPQEFDRLAAKEEGSRA